MCGITPDFINKLPHSTDIFVFGSNELGLHGGGAAKHAHQTLGAIWGIGVGRMGNAWALPTKAKFDVTLTPEQIKPYVKMLWKDVAESLDTDNAHYFITEVGCGLAGLTYEEVAPLFNGFIHMPNCSLPLNFINVINSL